MLTEIFIGDMPEICFKVIQGRELAEDIDEIGSELTIVG